MKAINKLYTKNNYTIQKSINIEEELYSRIKEVSVNNYDATISDLINVSVEELLKKDINEFYEKPTGEILIYRSIMLRKENIEKLNKFSKMKRVSVTRLVNMAIKEFLEGLNQTKGIK